MPITQTQTCPHCQSQNLVKFGFAPDNRQRYRCKDCRKQHRENRRSNAYSQAEKDIIIKATQERSSLRGIQRTFGVDRHTVSGWVKKRQLNSQT